MSSGRLSPLLPLLLVLPVLAGCLGGVAPEDPSAPTQDPSGPSQLFTNPLIQDHDHKDPALHDLSHNFERLDWDPVGASDASSAGAHAMFVRGDRLFVANYGEVVGADGGFHILDISDPKDPETIGRFRWPGAIGGDRSIAATTDGNYVLLGTETVDCAGHVNPFAPGLYLVDVTEPSAPVVVDHYAATGVHSVFVHEIDGEQIVFANTAPDTTFHVDTSGPVAQLEPINDLGFGHDIWAYDDPLADATYLLASDGSAGFHMYDVSQPEAPENIGTWKPDDIDSHYIHTAVPLIRGDQRLVVVTSEDWLDHPSPMWLLDMTHPGTPLLVSEWSNPAGVPSEALRFSLHNPRMTDEGELVFAHYHGGVWALDLDDPADWTDPEVLGYHLPHEDTGYRPTGPRTKAVADNLCGKFHLEDVPSTFDVAVRGDVIYAADLHTGLYTLQGTWENHPRG